MWQVLSIYRLENGDLVYKDMSIRVSVLGNHYGRNCMDIYAYTSMRQLEGVVKIKGLMKIIQDIEKGVMGQSRSKWQESKHLEKPEVKE